MLTRVSQSIMNLVLCNSLSIQFLLLLIHLFFLLCSVDANNLTLNLPIVDPETIVSNNGIFKLGFFSPNSSTNRYFGIWYNKIPKLTVIWVANRGEPIKDSLGSVTISKDGNLEVLNGQKHLIWSSSNFTTSTTNTTALLLDTGNLVLQDVSNGRTLWESFQHPSSSFVQTMRLSYDLKTGDKTTIASWTSPSDPSIGEFSLGIDFRRLSEIVIWKGTRPHWRSGPWDGRVFVGIQSMLSFFQNSIDLVDDRQGTTYLTSSFTVNDVLMYFQLTSEGVVERRDWYEGLQDSEVGWSAPKDNCGFYGKCGSFGICDETTSPVCSCLAGFVPLHAAEWDNGNFTSGCVRQEPLQCGTNNSKEDGFLMLKTVKVPDFIEWVPIMESACPNYCLNNCSCVAHAYHEGIGCMTWAGNMLIDMQKFNSTGVDIYVRVPHSLLDTKRDNEAVTIVSLSIGLATVAVLVYFSWFWFVKKRGGKKTNEILLDPLRRSDDISGDKLEELPQFKFPILLAATDRFSDANKIGQGGFGPVFKGKLENGQEIAVKRLSSNSGQGPEEFLNEVKLISKLQHRNLVRLLGCCVEREEKMLVYEYLSNKSLDGFLFDSQKQELLDWKRRMNIIEGIGRGLLYLHRDSRLRIIHRDLKASNILLDNDLNPKISDFGLARIFGYNEHQANTKRVVGTYGYMAPEYAMEGRFSEKSDVFSYGILLLEIVNGRRNTSFYNDMQYLSLLSLAWNSWIAGNMGSLIDTKVPQEGFVAEIFRCIHVGLLCVQEFADDRPSVSSALSMLSSETANLPQPKQPPFSQRLNPQSRVIIPSFMTGSSSNEDEERCSMNQITITTMNGR